MNADFLIKRKAFKMKGFCVMLEVACNARTIKYHCLVCVSAAPTFMSLYLKNIQ